MRAEDFSFNGFPRRDGERVNFPARRRLAGGGWRRFGTVRARGDGDS